MHHPGPITGNLSVLRQGSAVVAQLSNEQYAGHAPGKSSVGAQYRHVLDHYSSLLTGLENGLVDYDARVRDPKVETDRQEAVRQTARQLDALARLSGARLGHPLQVRLASAPGQPDEAQPSSVGRELLFLLSHTVHHYAIIRLLLEERGFQCEEEFGVAPSTLAYQKVAG